MGEAQLIKPNGERIVLPPHIYERVIEMLVVDESIPQLTRDELKQVIAETMGKYAGGKSMTEALLQMRAEDRTREQAKDAEIAKRFFSKRSRKGKKARVRAG